MTAVMFTEHGDRLHIIKKYATVAAAKAARTRLSKREDMSEVKILERVDFDLIDSMIEVQSLMNRDGPPIKIKRSTPIYCDPSFESYWSM